MPNGHSSATYRLFRLCRAGDLDAREALIASYMPLARRLARKYSRSSIPQEDLSQVASLALVKAVDHETVERSMLIGQLTAGLGEREQLLLRLRFDGDMTQSQIAERIGVSQMQVSRLLHAEFEKLRAEIGDDVPV